MYVHLCGGKLHIYNLYLPFTQPALNKLYCSQLHTDLTAGFGM